MKIELDDNKIFINNGSTDAPYVIMTKPEVDDYSNITARQLVVSYHLEEENIWDRACCFMRGLQNTCGESPYLVCYCLLFEQLYTVLLSNNQAKNIIGYGITEKEHVSDGLNSFMTFLQENSSFILLPEKQFSFSALLNKSCHAAVVNLDRCMNLTIICDIISKIRCGGKLLLYTKNDSAPKWLDSLIDRALKNSLGSGAVYSIAIDAELSTFACENNSESEMIPSIGNLLNMLDELKKLTAIMENNEGCPLEIYPSAVELLWQIEKYLIDLYDVLENPELPVFANQFREAVMNCYIGIANRFDAAAYFDRLHREAQAFYEKIGTEFGTA